MIRGWKVKGSLVCSFCKERFPEAFYLNTENNGRTPIFIACVRCLRELKTVMATLLKGEKKK